MSSGRTPITTRRSTKARRAGRSARSSSGIGSSNSATRTARPPSRLDDAGLEQVHRRRADEAGHEEVQRVVVQPLRLLHLLEHALADDGHPVAHRHRFGLVVRDVDRRDLEVVLDAGDLRSHLHAQLRVEVRERFVHQERVWMADDRPSHGDPLALAPGQRSRLAAEELLEAEDLRGVADPLVDLTLGDLLQLQPEGHVLEHGHVRVERVVLEDHRDVAVLRRHVVHHGLADRDAASRDDLEAGDHSQRRRLPAARGSDEHHELAVLDRQVERATPPRCRLDRSSRRCRGRSQPHAQGRSESAVVTSSPSSPPCGTGLYYPAGNLWAACGSVNDRDGSSDPSPTCWSAPSCHRLGSRDAPAPGSVVR